MLLFGRADGGDHRGIFTMLSGSQEAELTAVSSNTENGVSSTKMRFIVYLVV